MLIIPKSEFLKLTAAGMRLISNGSVFIYPTDTIYGIGCDARNAELVSKIRDIKLQKENPFSVIAPSLDWIRDNLRAENMEEWLEKLPGPYTLIMKIKNKDCVAAEVTLSKDTLGVRIPDNWFAIEVAKTGVPIVTTSVNEHGDNPIVCIDDVKESIKSCVDFAIDDGNIKGSPSTLVDLTKSPPNIIGRE